MCALQNAIAIWENGLPFALTVDSKAIKAKPAERDLKNHIHRRGSRNTPLTEREEVANKTRSKVRARVEYVFGN